MSRKARSSPSQLKSWELGCEIVIVDQVTEGAAYTDLLAKGSINNYELYWQRKWYEAYRRKRVGLLKNCEKWMSANVSTLIVGRLCGLRERRYPILGLALINVSERG